ncbi:MAG: Type 1 glutamine amidotransferase-like domain-containing protein, partial [Patescibacteria group bacterium]
TTLKRANILHFCGGSVLYLISLIKEKGFAEMIVKAVKDDEIIYSGTSAGSMIASSDLRLSSYDDEDAEFAKKMRDFSGLGLVNFLIIPHVNNKDCTKSNLQMIEHLPENLQTLIFINDDQAIWVDDGKLEILHN